jgi:tetratricopeptide (TPR) repeat protein
MLLLFTRLLALDDDPAGVRVDLGVTYKQNLLPDEARKHFQLAIAENPGYVNAYSWLGYTDIDQNLPDAARVKFEKVIQMAPRDQEGYWAMSTLAEQAQQWQDAISWCDRASQCHPGWESIASARRGELLRKSNKLEDAEKELARSLSIESNNPPALDSLSSLADDFLKHNDAGAVGRTLKALRRWKGDSYEPIYQNRVGNLWYSFKNFAVAVESYRKAIAASPSDDVLHSNLALAFEGLRQPGKRAAELEAASVALRRARELKPNNQEYSLRLDAMELESRFIAAYGEAALKHSTSVTLIRIGGATRGVRRYS